MFAFNDVAFAYKSHSVLEQFNLTAQSGELICLYGPSGVGKTTLLNLISGLLTPLSGSVCVKASRLGYVFQEPRLLPWCSAEENLELPLISMQIPKPERRQRVSKLLDHLGLSKFAQHYPAELSGGMKQRVALGRAFAVEPDLLIMDEPFSSLDEQIKYEMICLFKSLRTLRPCTAVLVTHNPREAMELSDRIVILSGQPCNIDSEILIDRQRLSNPDYSSAIWNRLDRGSLPSKPSIGEVI